MRTRIKQKPDSRTRQRQEVNRYIKLESKIKVGEKWYAIDQDWFTRFNETEDILDAVDNSSIWDEETEGLRSSAAENSDYILLPRAAYKCIEVWFKVAPVLEFEVKLNAQDKAVIDLFPARFKIEVVEINPEEKEDMSNISSEEADDNAKRKVDNPEKEEEIPQKDVKQNKQEEDEEKTDMKEDAGLNELEEKEDNFKSEGEEGESDKEESDKNKPKTILLKASRYDKLGKLKGLVARELNVRVRQLQIFIRNPADEDKKLVDVDSLPEEDKKKQMIDILPKVGETVYEIRCLKTILDENALGAEFQFTPEDPQVGQFVDAYLTSKKAWVEARIIEVIGAKKKIETQHEDKSTKKGKTKSSDVKVRVHFLSFDNKLDKVYKVDSDSVDIAYARVPDWRNQIKKGTKVEVHKSIHGFNKEWCEGIVTVIDRRGLTDLRSLYAKQISKTKGESKEKGLLKKFRKMLGKKKGKNKKQKSAGTEKASKQRSDSVDSNSLMISDRGLVKVEVTNKEPMSYYQRLPPKSCIVDLGSESIAMESTHLQKKKTPQRNNYFGLSDVKKKPEIEGVVGLRNLGNTCYMNSTLQCLLATAPITEYFLSGEHKNDINRKNRMGSGGKLADAYAGLVKRYFSGSYSVLRPHNFKSVIGSCLPQFAGIRQHDSQEFLTELLDGLKEDLNKVLVKPNTEIPEPEGRSDAEMFKICWDIFESRNKSIFIDHLFGMTKSHLICPSPGCKKEAKKYEAYNNLPLHIPEKQERDFKILFISIHPRLVKVEIDSKTKKETHTVVTKRTSEDEDLRETRYIWFSYTAQHRLFGTKMTFEIADKMGVPRTQVASFMFENNKTDKEIHLPAGEMMLYARLHIRKMFVVYELEPFQDVSFVERCNKKKLQVIMTHLDSYAVKDQGKSSVNKAPKKIDTPNESDPEKSHKKDVKDESNEKGKPGKETSDNVEEPIEKIKPKAVADKDAKPNEENSLPQKTAKISEVSSDEEDIVNKESADKVKTEESPEKKQSQDETKEPVTNESDGKKEKSLKSIHKDNEKQNTKAPKEEGLDKKSSRSTNNVDEEKKDADKAKNKKEAKKSEVDTDDNLEFSIVYKKSTYVYGKRLKPDEYLHLNEKRIAKMTHKDIYIIVWKRCKYMFRLEKLKDNRGYGAESHTVNDEELVFAEKYLKIKYASKEIKLTSDKPFEVSWSRRGETYLNTITVDVLNPGAKDFHKTVKTDPPNVYLYSNKTYKELSKGLNAPFVALDESARTASESEDAIDIYQCFDAFSKSEVLSEMDAWYCNKCKEHVRATKKMNIYCTGDILIIMLKRFSQVSSFQRRKLENLVNFPITDLDLTDYIEGDQCKKFDLYAVSYHIGGLHGGHYTAKVKVNDNWYDFNDSSVSKTTPEEVVNSKAYVLFYKRKDTTVKSKAGKKATK